MCLFIYEDFFLVHNIEVSMWGIYTYEYCAYRLY
jgi:hypothetical protein